MLSSFQLARMKSVLNRLLVDACTIEAETNAIGVYGEPVHTWQTVANSVPCRLITTGKKKAEAAIVGGAETMVESYTLVCPAGTQLAPNQRITLASDGSIYQVVGLITTDRSQATDSQAVVTRAR